MAPRARRITTDEAQAERVARILAKHGPAAKAARKRERFLRSFEDTRALQLAACRYTKRTKGRVGWRVAMAHCRARMRKAMFARHMTKRRLEILGELA